MTKMDAPSPSVIKRAEAICIVIKEVPIKAYNSIKKSKDIILHCDKLTKSSKISLQTNRLIRK